MKSKLPFLFVIVCLFLGGLEAAEVRLVQVCPIVNGAFVVDAVWSGGGADRIFYDAGRDVTLAVSVMIEDEVFYRNKYSPNYRVRSWPVSFSFESAGEIKDGMIFMAPLYDVNFVKAVNMPGAVLYVQINVSDAQGVFSSRWERFDHAEKISSPLLLSEFDQAKKNKLNMILSMRSSKNAGVEISRLWDDAFLDLLTALQSETGELADLARLALIRYYFNELIKECARRRLIGVAVKDVENYKKLMKGISLGSEIGVRETSLYSAHLCLLIGEESECRARLLDILKNSEVDWVTQYASSILRAIDRKQALK